MVLRVRVGSTNNGIPFVQNNKLTGPVRLFAPGSPIRYVGVLCVTEGHSGADDYIAISFGPNGVAIPVQSGDVYGGRALAAAGVFAWSKGGTNQLWFLDIVGTDFPLRPGWQALTQIRIPGFAGNTGYPFE